MKKIVTITGAASVLALLPTVGVFAADATGTTVTDSVEITISSACNITATSLTPTYTATMNNSQLKSDIGGTAMSISCNDAAGWKLMAVGSSSSDSSTKTQMIAGSSGGTNIATGTATSGATSNWAFKLTGTGVTSGYTSFKAVPSTAAKVASGSGTVSGNTITTGYQVWISATQAADTYTGKVTYTLSHPAS